MPVVMVGSALGIFAYITGNSVYSKYLLFPTSRGAGELLIFCGAMPARAWPSCGSTPTRAQVFMGDVGALALGGALGTIAVITRPGDRAGHHGRVFVAEALSVMIQVSWFKHTKKRYGGAAHLQDGAAAPPLREKGWTETQVVVRFWIITMLLCLVGLASLKLRCTTIELPARPRRPSVLVLGLGEVGPGDGALVRRHGAACAVWDSRERRRRADRRCRRAAQAPAVRRVGPGQHCCPTGVKLVLKEPRPAPARRAHRAAAGRARAGRHRGDGRLDLFTPGAGRPEGPTRPMRRQAIAITGTMRADRPPPPWPRR